MHELERIAAEVDVTHPNVGPLVAAGVMCVVARRMFLAIAPPGCGKSMAGKVIRDTHPDKINLDSVTRAGLKDWAKELSDFGGVVIADDLGKTGGKYHRLEMMLGFADLVYEGHLQRTTITTGYSIQGYHGAAIFNCQPGVLQGVMESEEWDATIADKTIRYYHLFRPIHPNEASPEVFIDWEADMTKVEPPDVRQKPYNGLLTIGEVQWGRARAMEHVRAFLRAAAALDRRAFVDETDYAIVRELMRPMVVERRVVNKPGWDTGRFFNVGLLCLLIEFATYGDVTLANLMADYKMDEPATMGAMMALSKHYDRVPGREVVFRPKPDIRQFLDAVKPKIGGLVNTDGEPTGNASVRRGDEKRSGQVSRATGAKGRSKKARGTLADGTDSGTGKRSGGAPGSRRRTEDGSANGVDGAAKGNPGNKRKGVTGGD